MVTDEMIRAALERIAERAPDGVGLRAGLAGRARLRRQRRTIVLAGGAAAATVAAGVPAATLWPRRKAPAVAPSEPAQPPNRIPLRWRPAWLPDGLVELRRSASFDDEVTEWLRGWGPHPTYDRGRKGLPAVVLWMARDRDLPKIGRPVSINGGPGRIHNDAGAPECGVLWLGAPGQLLTVSVTKMPPTGDPEEIGLRVARSVVADPLAVCEVTVAFGWLPPGYGDTQQTFDLGVSVKPGEPVTPAARVESVFLRPANAAPAALATLTIGVDRPRPEGAQDVTVRGRPGWLVWNEQDESVVYVRLDDGRPLVLTVEVAQIHGAVHMPLPSDRNRRAWTRDELLRVVDEIRLGPVPDLSWVGRR
jgi:hypothetical protein